MGEDTPTPEDSSGGLQRHFGLWQATALNVTMIVGAGVFITIPPILEILPGPYALWAWIAAGVLILLDGLVWGELAATFPSSGGSYLYLLECYGRERWGRLMAFLFVWQFLISGPLEIASGLIAMSLFAQSLSPTFGKWDAAWTRSLVVGEWQEKELKLFFGPSRVAMALVTILLIWLLYRRINSLGRLTVTFWVGVLAVMAWILIEGQAHFSSARFFDYEGPAASPPPQFGWKLGAAMILAMYSYLGYYNVCYIGGEVRDPGRTIPRSILLSAVLVCVVFIGLHLAMLGTVSWLEAPANLPAAFMARIHGEGSWAVTLVSVLLLWSCAGAAFAALLGYSRIPYGAARRGHFFAVFGRLHPRHHIPHISLLLVGALTLFWAFFDLEPVINALIVTRVLEQFLGQGIGLLLLRRTRPDLPRPYRMPLYPVPCVLALLGWAYLYASASLPYILLGLGTLTAGIVAFLAWSWWTKRWPFPEPR